MTVVSEQARRELAPEGRLRAAINYGNAVLVQRDPATEGLSGITVDLARELARKLGVAPELFPFDAAGRAVEALGEGRCDVGFLARDPKRAETVAFTEPYLVIRGSYIVRDGSPLTDIESMDRPGVRIAVGRGAAYDLFLTRALRDAELVRVSTSAEAIETFVDQGLDAAAGVRQPLEAYAESHPGFRVLPGHFTSIEQAMCTPRGRVHGAAYLATFIRRMREEGFVAAAVERHGQSGVEIPRSAGGEAL